RRQHGRRNRLWLIPAPTHRPLPVSEPVPRESSMSVKGSAGGSAPARRGRHRRARSRPVPLLIAGIVLVALVLRSPVTGLGAVLGQVSRDLHLNGLTAGIATTLPVICFAFLGALAPLGARR